MKHQLTTEFVKFTVYYESVMFYSTRPSIEFKTPLQLGPNHRDLRKTD
jgi:hypothetical protein